SIEEAFLQKLELAKSNIAENKDGRTIYNKFVKPAMVDRKSVAAHYALSSMFESYPDHARIYCYSVDREDFSVTDAGRSRLSVGRARITSEITTESEVFSFGTLYMGDHMMNAGVRPYEGEEEYNALRQELA